MDGRLGLIIPGTFQPFKTAFQLIFRFQQLYDIWKESGVKFSSLDYSVETPTWAVYGSEERGFDPEMKRHHRNRKIRSVPAGANGPSVLQPVNA